MAYFDAPYRPADLTLNSDAINSSLVGFWPLTDGSGSSAVDVSTGGNNGTQSGGVGWATSEIGTVASFDGVDDRFNVDDAGAFDFGTGDFSVSAWVYFDTLTNKMRLVSRGDTSLGTACWFAIRKDQSVYGSQFAFDIDDNVSKVTITSSVSATTGVWFHVVGVRNSGGTIAFYINGDLAGTASDNGNSMSQSGAANQQLMIGCLKSGGAYQDFHDGDIQNVRIFNAALTQAQVEQLYTRPWTGTNYDSEALWLSPPASLTLSTASESTSIMADIEGWWVMTDGSGTTLTDISGNGRDATLNGTNTWETETLGTVNRFDNSVSRTSHAETANTQPDLTGGYTFSTWVKHEEAGLSGSNAYGAGIVLGNSSGSSDVEIYFNVTNNTGNQWPQVVHNRNNGGAISDNKHTHPISGAAKANDNGVWVHYAVTSDGSATRAFRNGEFTNQKTITNNPLSNSGYKLYINELPVVAASGGLTCSMQNTRLWSRALSDSEISLLYERPWIGAAYNETAPLYPPVPSSLTPLDSSSINTDLQGWWPLTETDNFASGAADISGNGNNGTQTGGVLSEFSELGTVASFDGSNDRFSISTDLSRNQTAFSCSAWIRPDAVDRRFIWYESNSLNALQARFGLRTETSGNLQCVGRDDDGDAFTVFAQSGSGVVSTNKWQHVVGIFDPTGNGCKVFLDGVDVTSSSVNTGDGFPDTASLVQSIGTASTNYYWFDGLLSNVRVWSRALSASEVADLYYSPWLGSSAYPSTGGGTPSYFVAAQFNRLGIGPRFRRL